MQRLVSTNEAAAILGLSVQGVHYRIKTNKLDSIKKNGKTYVYIEDTNTIPQKDNNKQTNKTKNSELDYIIQLKDEQISLLKKTIKLMRNQYKSEIKRLEKNQAKLVEVFKSEIILLQKAYNEMQKLYKSNIPRLKIKDKNDTIELVDFFILMKKHNKSNFEIKSLILERIKAGDNRFLFDNKNKKIIIYNDDFTDIIN